MPCEPRTICTLYKSKCYCQIKRNEEKKKRTNEKYIYSAAYTYINAHANGKSLLHKKRIIADKPKTTEHL